MPSAPGFPVLYEDNHLLVIEKPAGLLSQADASGADDVLTLAKAYVKERYQKPGEVFLGLVHRLDRDVGGVFVLARTSKAAARLSEQFRAHSATTDATQHGTVRKFYEAVLERAIQPAEGVFEDRLAKNEATRTAFASADGRPARLRYHTLETPTAVRLRPLSSNARDATARHMPTQVAVELETGRFHQIRFQFARRGAPILGDRKYGATRGLVGIPLALHCVRLEFQHPTRGETLRFSSRPPWAAD